MAEKPLKKNSGKQPISRHPLFPAVVALWFGALFGLGSLVVRPALIESVVAAMRIDAVIPSAGAPLGVTTRILLVLTMAGIGGLIGAFLARRIARPRPVIHERKRGAGSVGEVHKTDRFSTFFSEDDSDGHINPRLDDAPDIADSTDQPAMRRRTLAMAEDPRGSDYEERAPLPGGALHILNVGDFDLDGFEEAGEAGGPIADSDQVKGSERRILSDPFTTDNGRPAQPHEGAQVFAPTAKPDEAAAEAPPEPANADVSPIPAFAAPDALGAGTDTDLSETHRFAPRKTDDALTSGNRLFEAYTSKPQDQDSLSAPTWEESEKPGFAIVPRFDANDNAGEPGNFAPHDERETAFAPFAAGDPAESEEAVDGTAYPGPFSTPSSDRIGQAIVGEPVESEEEFWADPKDSGDTEFAGAAEAMVPPGEIAAVQGDDDHEQKPGDEETAAQAHISAFAESEQPPLDSQSAAERIATANLDELSPVELLERLALSLERRRQRAALAQIEVQAEPSGGDDTASLNAETISAIDEHDDAAITQPAFAGNIDNSDDPATDDLETDDADDDKDRAPEPRPLALPAALRPIWLDDDGEEELVPSYVPPRHIGVTFATANFAAPGTTVQNHTDKETAAAGQSDNADAPGPFATPNAAPVESGKAESDDDQLDEEDRALEEGYSSLLNLSRPAQAGQQFVRIEEPEPQDGAIEPVVVFPDRAPSQQAPFAKPDDTTRPESFVAPDGQPVARHGDDENHSVDSSAYDDTGQNVPAPQDRRQDAAETERSLRAAIATLQRMSGAA